MADTIVTEDTGFTPEPVPDNIADTELNGLAPADESTDSEQVEDSQDETTDDQSEEATATETEEPDTNSEETTVKAEEAPEQTETKASDDAEARHKFNSEQAALRVQQRQERQNFFNQQRAQIREVEQETPADDVAQKLAILEAKQWVDTVERNQGTLLNENLRAQQEIPLFNPGSPEWNQGGAAIYQAAVNRFNDAYVVTDPDSNQVVGAYDRQGNQVSLLNYLQQEAANMGSILNTTQQQVRVDTTKAEAKMRAKAVNPANTGKTTSSGDELADLLDKIGDVSLI
jgi:hypothetical protein